MPLHFVSWSLTQFQSFLLIAMRVSPILFMMPLLGSRNLPVLLKAGLTMVVSLILLPVVQVDPSLFSSDPLGFVFFLASEMMIGFFLGLSVKLVFAAAQFAGELIGFQMGLSMANVVDPQSGVDTPLMGQWHYLVGLLIFLAIDGHHWFFRALSQSFHHLPPGGFHLKAGLYQHLLALTGRMFVVAVKMAAPVMAVLTFTQIALGMVAKTVPQVHVLIISFPLTIGLGLVFLGFTIELFVPYLGKLFDESGRGLGMTLLPLMRK